MRYRVYEDAYYSTVELTNRPLDVDGYNPVFSTLGEAKRYLLEKLTTERDYYAEAVRDTRTLTKADLRNERNVIAGVTVQADETRE